MLCYILILIYSSERPTARQCTEHVWIQRGLAPKSNPLHVKPIATARLRDYIERHQ